MDKLPNAKQISSARPRGRGDPGFARNAEPLAKTGFPLPRERAEFAGSLSPSRQRQAEWQRQREEDARALSGARRKLFTAFRIWQVCPAKLCQRQHACRGDAERCMNERWHRLAPPALKAFLGKVFDGVRDGLEWQEAIAAAEASMAEHLRRAQPEASADRVDPLIPADAATHSVRSRESGNPVLGLPGSEAKPGSPLPQGRTDQSYPAHPRAPRIRGL